MAVLQSQTSQLPSENRPPTYRIDLSLAPHLRYKEICRDYKDRLVHLVEIYDEILGKTYYPRQYKLLNFLAKKLLSRVHSKEENEEIRGIAEATGMERHLVVAYNTFLDLFSGCTSGGVKVNDAGARPGIVHFRNLDWAMEPLRRLMICVEYVHEGNVVARCVHA
jgi:hypothetical protein